MRNYIILNGKISTTIRGLLIQELPPITKPQIRTEVEEIDGRDGDIVTKLGYSAYNRDFTIGLYGDYDIDSIIEYFNSEGIVVFSNEPDKYYKYQILEEINFERLLRFRTATVTMHVQPFKYSATDNVKIFETSNNIDKSISIRNVGNVFSKPRLTIEGSGLIYILINGVQVLVLNIGTFGKITIDPSIMEAYNGNQLLNRYVNGDYEKCKLKVGKNVISWTGRITQLKIENYSRWI